MAHFSHLLKIHFKVGFSLGGHISDKPFFQVIVALAYVWIIYGLILLMSPWWFRKFYRPFLENAALFKAAALAKTAMGLILIVLGLRVY